jgi:glutamyl-Q tRNA(Asp) synthetase
MPDESRPVFRFAPSPNGPLHLGHALSAILNFDAAQTSGGRFLLRIEDIDAGRTREEFVTGIEQDLRWLGLTWERPVRRQSRHLDDYARALDKLKARGLVYPCLCARGDVARAVAARARGDLWPRDPDGAFLYPGTCLGRRDEVARRVAEGESAAWRLDMETALAVVGPDLVWSEEDDDGVRHDVAVDARACGDVVVARRDIGVSYHLAVVVDDALQGVTDVVRGMDLYRATAIHRALQALLGLPAPRYRHHRLVVGDDGAKLAKSRRAPALRDLRDQGATAADVRRSLGLS